MRLTLPLLITIATVMHAAPAAAANARHQPCAWLRPDVMEHAIDYGLERSNQGEFESAPDVEVRIDVDKCQRQSPGRATWRYRMTILVAETYGGKMAVRVREQGSVMVTARRGTFTPDPEPSKVAS